MRDLFIEIAGNIRRNKMRTCLTGFAVSWGIFMLIVLLGAGNGLMNAFLRDAQDVSVNTMQIGGNRTSKPYDGLKEGRRIRLDAGDVDLLRGEAFADVIDDVSPTVSASASVVLSDKYFSTTLQGDYPERVEMDGIRLLHGRFVNSRDIRQKRKIIVLPSSKAEQLVHGATPISSLVGRDVKVGNFIFKVAGIYEADASDNESYCYVPFTTLKSIYLKGEYVDDITFSFHGISTLEEGEAFESRLRAAVNSRHRASPTDLGAIWVWNRFVQSIQMDNGMSILNKALWIVGLFTLLSGIVGVSNIMLISVRERTHEFGIRKAIGAKPSKIMSLIISESVVVTTVFGYIGMVAGMLACEVLDKTVGQSSLDVMGETISFLKNISVGLDVALEATVLLIIAGTIAGLIPARKAAKVRPIEALRAE